MVRGRWLVFLGCLALLRFLPACTGVCLNPQPEPPGGCGSADGTGPAGRGGAGGAPADAGAVSDAPIVIVRDVSVDSPAEGADAASEAGIDTMPIDAPDEATSEASTDVTGDATEPSPDTAVDDAADDADPDAGDTDRADGGDGSVP